MAMLNTSQAAAKLKVSARRVLALIKAGSLKAERFGRDWALDAGEVDRFSKIKRRPGPKPSKPRKK
jgi:excisionase family DNA binding protein